MDNAELDNAELEGWARLGQKVRQARLAVGYTNRENFAEVCNVSVRVLSDLESGVRTNFTDRVLSRLEEGLGWPAGTMNQIVADPTYNPPGPVVGGDLIFRPPTFDRRPANVDVSVVERAIAVLSEASRTSGAAVGGLGAVLVDLCWPYVIRLIEDNCLPGTELHPAVRPFYDAFEKLAVQYAPNSPDVRYAQWLVGDARDVNEPVRQRYLQRWAGSRGEHRHRRPRDHQDGE